MPESLLWLGYGYAVVGQIPMAIAFAERLLRVDPLTSINLCMRGMVSMFDGRLRRRAPLVAALGRHRSGQPDEPDNACAHARRERTQR